MWKKLTGAHFADAASNGKALVCRLERYSNSKFHIGSNKYLDLPLFNQYFIVTPGAYQSPPAISAMTTLIPEIFEYVEDLRIIDETVGVELTRRETHVDVPVGRARRTIQRVDNEERLADTRENTRAARSNISRAARTRNTPVTNDRRPRDTTPVDVNTASQTSTRAPDNLPTSEGVGRGQQGTRTGINPPGYSS